jgi:hypothetical protein
VLLHQHLYGIMHGADSRIGLLAQDLHVGCRPLLLLLLLLNMMLQHAPLLLPHP